VSYLLRPLKTNLLTVKAAKYPKNSISALWEGAAESVTCLADLERPVTSDLTNPSVQNTAIPTVATTKATRLKNLVRIFCLP
jgi:hypothetical protein